MPRESIDLIVIGGGPGGYVAYPLTSVGYSEREAREKRDEMRIGRFSFAGNGKAVTLREPIGLVKAIFDKRTGALLGAHTIGMGVTELIHRFAIAKTLETTEVERTETIFLHPTLSEMMHESVLEAFGRAIHL